MIQKSPCGRYIIKYEEIIAVALIITIFFRGIYNYAHALLTLAYLNIFSLKIGTTV